MIRDLSATQIDLAKLCLRKWACRYISDLPKPPQKESQRLGSAVHLVAENYLKTGVKPDRSTREGEIFLRGLPFLPGPGKGTVEGKTKIEIGGIKYVMIIDFETRACYLPDWSLGNMPVVLDHKTSSNPKRYAKRPDQLVVDTQGILYSHLLISKHSVSEVGLRWLYYPTKTKTKRKATPVDSSIFSEFVFDNYKELIEPTARTLINLYKERPHYNDVTPSPWSCYEYNEECPYRGVCNLTSQQRVEGMFNRHNKENDMSTLQNKMATGAFPMPPGAQTQQIQAPPGQVAPPAPPAPPASPVPPNGTIQPGGVVNPPVPATQAQIAPQAAPPVAPPVNLPPQTQVQESTPVVASEPVVASDVLGMKVQLACALIVSRGAVNIDNPAAIATEVDQYLDALKK